MSWLHYAIFPIPISIFLIAMPAQAGKWSIGSLTLAQTDEASISSPKRSIRKLPDLEGPVIAQLGEIERKTKDERQNESNSREREASIFREKEATEYHGARNNVLLLQAYVDTCKICEFKSDAIAGIATVKEREKSRYYLARGDLDRLSGYVRECQICEFKETARSDIARSEQTQHQTRREAAEYQAARGNLDRLRAYERTCQVCDFKNAALSEISQLEKKIGSGGPFVPTIPLLRRRTAEFVKDWHALFSGPNTNLIDTLSDKYADRVDYFGKTFSRDEVLADKRNFIELWSLRHYTPKDQSIHIQCTEATLTCTAEGILEFDSRSLKRSERKTGTATFEVTLVYASPAAAPKVTREAGEVLQKKSERYKAR